ncbi:hypothetical protein Plec18170_009480 [Paecilomyces lecythidis]
MAVGSKVERLTPLDILMPRTYIATLLTFRTTQSVATLSRGLELPEGGKHGLEIRWDATEGNPAALIDKGSVPIEYDTSAGGLLPEDIPSNVWSVPSFIDDDLFSKGAPVFAASIFRFSDNKGVGLCICMHHNAVDATGFAEVLRLWTKGLTALESHSLSPLSDRVSRLSNALSAELKTVSSMNPDELFHLHPEYSPTPPTLPISFPPCSCKLFAFPILKINDVKERLDGQESTMRSTNAVLCAIIWSAITAARKQSDSDLAKGTSKLVTAVNGRRRIKALSTPEYPYLGNTVLYSLAEASVESLSVSFDEPSNQILRSIADTVSQSQSSTQIHEYRIVEVYKLADSVDDYRAIFPGWDIFGARDMVITSWANLGLYDLDFGTGLGKPEFVRIRGSPADGVAIILPRRNDVLEVMLMLRTHDMDVLEQDSMWTTFVN